MLLSNLLSTERARATVCAMINSGKVYGNCSFFDKTGGKTKKIRQFRDNWLLVEYNLVNSE